MEFIEKADRQHLQFVLCGYGQNMMYHEYDAENDTLKAGTNLTVETAKALFKFVNNQSDFSFSFKGLIPKNVLKFSTDEKHIAWYSMPKMVDMVFDKEVPIENGKYPAPIILWVLKGRSIDVFALKTIPETGDERVFQAPYFNINDSGNLCTGTAKFASKSVFYEDIMARVEAVFWNSLFTHTNCDDLLTMNYVQWCAENLNKEVDFNNDLLVQRDEKIINVI